MKSIVFLVTFLLSLGALGQAGSLDTTFNSYLVNRFGHGGGLLNGYYDCTSEVLSDGKLLIGGTLVSYNGVPSSGVIKLNSDGSIDQSFVTYFADPCTVNAIAVQTDGKILFGGNFTTYAGVSCKDLIRINPDGTLDQSFQIGAGPYNPDNNEEVLDLSITSDGKIIVMGDFTKFNNIVRRAIVRLDSNGTVDQTFGSTIGAQTADGPGINCMAVQPDGKIIVGGYFDEYQNNNTYGIARLTPDGGLDPTFYAGNGILGYEQEVLALAVQPDGKILIGGDFSGYYTNNGGFNIVRTNPNGSFDSTFQFPSTPDDAFVRSIDLQSDGKIILVGDFDNSTIGEPNHQYYRVNTDGSIDSTFNISNLPDEGEIENVQVLSDDQILFRGSFEMYGDYNKSGLVKLKPDGEIDQTFSPCPGATFASPVNTNSTIAAINVIVSQPDGKKLIGGTFSEYNGIRRMGIARLNQDGTLDTTFNVTTDVEAVIQSYYEIKSIVLQPDGKILVGGLFSMFNDQQVNNLIRLNSDGTIDPSFMIGNGYGTDGIVHSIAIQTDGNIVIGGGFTTVNGVLRNKMARISADGATVDLGFNINYSGSDPIKSIRIISNKIYFIRWYSLYRVMLTTGTADNSIGFSELVKDYAFQDDGKILVVGEFQGPKRYNTNFGPDFTWTTPGFESTIINLDTENKIILANETGLFRLNPDGTTDNTFINDPQFAGAIFDLVFENERLIVVGYFAKYHNKFHNSIVAIGTSVPFIDPLQIYFDSITDVNCNLSGSIKVLGLFGTPPYTFDWQNLGSTDSVITVTTPGIYTCTVTDSNNDSKTGSLLISGPTSLVGNDLKTTLITNSFRPGFDATAWLNAFNDGCIPVSGQLKLAYDPLLDFVSSTPAPTSQNGDTLIWDFTDITYDSAHLTPQIVFNTSTQAVIGDTIHFTTIMTPIAGDADTTNNVKYYSSPVVNGYDPNIKSVYPVGKCDVGYIKQDQLLTYTVQFQNTGNSEAINIAVIDSLDTDLDVNTVRVVGRSHPMWTEVLPGNVLKFHFDNIQLPDSTNNEPESHGYVIFEVKPVSTLLNQNTEISNLADIYFDFNPPIRTNEVSNLIFQNDLDNYNCLGAGIEETAVAELIVFPNPANNLITIRTNQTFTDETIFITDLQGKIVLRKEHVNGAETTIDVSGLTNGIYLIRSQTNPVSSRLVKQ